MDKFSLFLIWFGGFIIGASACGIYHQAENVVPQSQYAEVASYLTKFQTINSDLRKDNQELVLALIKCKESKCK